MHWMLDVHFAEDKTQTRDIRIQKNLNMMRKIVINFVKQYQQSLEKHVPMSRIIHANLFDINHLSKFVTYFRQ